VGGHGPGGFYRRREGSGAKVDEVLDPDPSSTGKAALVARGVEEASTSSAIVPPRASHAPQPVVAVRVARIVPRARSTPAPASAARRASQVPGGAYGHFTRRYSDIDDRASAYDHITRR
jgi:hypothetical protein